MSTSTIELAPVRPLSPVYLEEARSLKGANVLPTPMGNADRNTSSVRLTSSPGRQLFEDDGPEASQNATVVVERWNGSKINVFRTAAVFVALFNLGINDATWGALMPSIEEYYNLNYIIVSLVFLAPFAGFVVAAIFSDRLHMKFGHRGVAIASPLLRTVVYLTFALHPPYGALIAILPLNGLSNGFIDASWNFWMGNLANPNQVLGFAHACYGVGGTLAPIIATTMVQTYLLPFYTYYYVPLGLSLLEFVLCTMAFWAETGAEFKRKASSAGDGSSRTRVALKQKVTWLVAIFLLMYVGTEVSLGGWIVTFMLRVRGAEPFASGMTATGFWLGLTAGRVVLGFVTPLIGERWSIAIYLALAAGLELLFWLVPQFIISAVAVALVGFFIGPMFPAAIIAISKLLPKKFHIGAIGFASALGGGGAAAVPFAVGAIAQARGVAVLQPIILALLAVQLSLWLLLPKIPKHAHSE